MDINLSDLEKAYNEAAAGRCEPDIITCYCPTCDRTFVLSVGGENIICDHLKEWYERIAKAR